jgi:hypothetical protein
MNTEFKIFNECMTDLEVCDDIPDITSNNYVYPTAVLANGQEVFVCGTAKSSIPDIWPFGNKKYLDVNSFIISEQTISRNQDLLFYIAGLSPNTIYDFDFNGILFSSISDDRGFLFICLSEPLPLAAMPLVSMRINTSLPNSTCNNVGVQSYNSFLKYVNQDNSIFISDTNIPILVCGYTGGVVTTGAIVTNTERIEIAQKTYYLTLGTSTSVNVKIENGTITQLY